MYLRVPGKKEFEKSIYHIQIVMSINTFSKKTKESNFPVFRCVPSMSSTFKVLLIEDIHLTDGEFDSAVFWI